jgi:hypothetical protein
MPKGPLPKPDGQRAGHRPLVRVNGAPAGATSAPPMPAAPPWMADGWPPQTVVWYGAWASALEGQLTPVGWSYLADTPLIHAAVWGQGQIKHLNELRYREAKLGLATPEDRARLGMEATTAADAEPEPVRKRSTFRDDPRYAGIRIVVNEPGGDFVPPIPGAVVDS